jgi:hypothetical protein
MKLSQFLTKAVFALEAAFFISHSGLLLVPLQFLPARFTIQPYVSFPTADRRFVADIKPLINIYPDDIKTI